MLRSGFFTLFRMFVLTGCAITLTVVVAIGAQQVNFSLAPSDSVTVGVYTLQYRGLTEQHPTYDLYVGGVLRAHFPSDPPPPNWSFYEYENVSIQTTAVTPDGMTATGTLRVD